MNDDLFPEITKANNFVELAYNTLDSLHKTSKLPDKDQVLIEGKNEIQRAWGLHQSADTSNQLTDAYARLIIAAGHCAEQLIE